MVDREVEAVEVLGTIVNPFLLEACDLLGLDIKACPNPVLCIEDADDLEGLDLVVSCQCERNDYSECFEAVGFYSKPPMTEKYEYVTRLFNIAGEMFRTAFIRAYVGGMTAEEAAESAATEVALLGLHR